MLTEVRAVPGAGEDLLGAGGVPGRELRDGKPQRRALERLADLHGFEEVGEGERGHRAAAVVGADDEPFGLQPAQGLAHGDAAHAELLGDLLLAQRQAPGELPAEDALAKLGSDAVGWNLHGK